jgi:hypothetical protein
MSKTARTELEVMHRHLTWAGESCQRAGQAVTSPTYKGPLAVALGDLAHLQRQIQQIILTLGAGRGG